MTLGSHCEPNTFSAELGNQTIKTHSAGDDGAGRSTLVHQTTFSDRPMITPAIEFKLKYEGCEAQVCEGVRYEVCEGVKSSSCICWAKEAQKDITRLYDCTTCDLLPWS